MNKMKSLKARDVSDDLMERKMYLVKDAHALIPLNLKVTVCYLHNNWRANPAWNKFEDKKVIIAKEPVPHNTPNHGTPPLTNLGGGSGPSIPHISMHGGRQQVSTENPRRDNRAATFLDNTNARQTGETKIHKTLGPFVVRSRRPTLLQQ